jgi:type I restriction enzyme S subunit
MKYSRVTLSDCCEFLDHLRRPVKESERISGPYPYFGANGQQGWIDDYLFDEPLVLLAEDGGHFSTPERGIAYKISGKTWVNNHAHVLRPMEGVITVDYLSHALRNKDVRRHLSGSTRDKLTKAGACQIEIPLPPLEEQRRIAAILDKAQRLEKNAEEQIRKLDSLACSIFDQVISESRDSDAVMDIALGDLSLLSGQYGAGCSSVPYDMALPRYVRITDIQEDGFLSSAKVSPSGSPAQWAGLELEPGDLLFARSGATVGKTYMHSDREGPCIFAGYLIRFRIDQRLAMPDYVYAFTRTEGYRKWVDRSQRTVAQPNINAKQYSELRIPLPSLEVQNSYCEKVKAVLSQSDSCRQRLNILRNLKLSLASNLIKA